MFLNICYGATIYEIVYDKSGPFILDWQITNFQIVPEGYFLYDKPIGVSLITEDMLGLTIFFSLNEAEQRLKYIKGVE